MVKKTKTMKVQGGAEYAQVHDRIKEFRTDCPNGSIKTKPEMLDDGQLFFKATVIKDLSDESSARADGSSYGKSTGTKSFEKLETSAVGRALAFLGYGADGAIASSEEMEDFFAYKEEKKMEVIVDIQKIKTLDELKTYFLSLGSLMADKAVIKAKDEMKVKLEK